MQQYKCEIKHKWNDENAERFRSGIIGCLPRFNIITQCIDKCCRESINKTVDEFSEIIRSVTIPLFSRCYFVNDKPFFSTKTVLKMQICFMMTVTLRGYRIVFASTTPIKL